MTPVSIDSSLPAAFDGIGKIGTGASGVVYEAIQRSTGRPVALKLLYAPLDDDAIRRRFARECAAMAALASHPHIVTILDAGTHDGRPWIAMELCRRGSLAGVGPLDVPTVLDVLIAVADAMDAAHRNNVLHCDLKPANILTTDYGAPAVGDFGIARPASAAATTATGGYSLDHAAPEVLDGHEPTAATDIYCLGATIWTLLTGRPPFREDASTPASAVAKKILLDPFPAAPPRTPPDLAALLAATTAKAPLDRIGSMAEVASRARVVRQTLPSRPRIPPRSPPPRPTVEPGPEAAEPTRHRPMRGGIAPDPQPAATPSRPSPTHWPTRVLLASTGVVLVGLLVAGIVAVARGVQHPTAHPQPPTTATPTTSSSPTAAAAAVVPELGLAEPQRDLACDGRYIVLIGSAVTPGRYPTDVAALLGVAPGSHYLLTAGSCGLFADRTSTGDLIYAVYLGPFDSLQEACSARTRPGAVVRRLVDTSPTAFPTC
jgi:serine/threonine protein kinase